MRIDLHTHSVASDGTETPGEVVGAAARAGLDVVALTDHDTTVGWAEAATAGKATGVTVVRGVEMSCRSGGRSLHLLAYLPDPHDAGLSAEAAAIRSARHSRARSIVDLLAVDYPLTWQDVLEQTGPGTTVGRPHIADALVARGHVPDRSAAFSSLLATGGRYYVPHYATPVLQAIGLVRAAGGVPVLAHPGAQGRDRPVSDRELEDMVGAGLVGLEVHHRDNPPDQVERLTAAANRWGLLVTGSSDYHGTGKPNRLGEHTTSPAVFEQIEALGRTEVVRP